MSQQTAESSGRGTTGEEHAENRADAAQKAGVTFCFGSAGWLFVYYFGVIKRIKELGLHRNARYISCSGGALAAAAGLCCDVSCDKIKDFVLECAEEARSSITGPFKLRDYTLGAIEKFSTEADLPKISGRTEVSVTVLPFMRNVRLSQFESFDFLKQALLASSCLVPLAGMPVHVEGLGWCVDGALSDLQVLKGLSAGGTFSKIHNKDSKGAATVTVCPFYCSRADVKPSRYLPPWWAFLPPSPKELEGVYRLGYTDMNDWLQARMDTAPEESWTSTMFRRSSQLMREASLSAALQRQSLERYLHENCPSVPELHLSEHLPHLPNLSEHLPALPNLEMPQMPHLPQFEMPQMPQMPQMPHLPQFEMPQMPQMPQMPALPQFEFEMPALPQCLSELLRGPTGLPGLLLLLLRQFLVFVAAVLVYTELFWNTLAWGTLATAAIVLPGWSPHSMYSRFHTYLGAATSPELAMYSTPLLGRFVSLHKQDLEDLSLMFRVLSFLLV